MEEDAMCRLTSMSVCFVGLNTLRDHVNSSNLTSVEISLHFSFIPPSVSPAVVVRSEEKAATKERCR